MREWWGERARERESQLELARENRGRVSEIEKKMSDEERKKW